jgi:thiol-disulfide isomerase/thioredoxin
MTMHDVQSGTVRAHELYGDIWFNSEPILIGPRRGSVVLLDFWDYACSGSLRAIPYIKEWHEKYGAAGLVVVGVHSPRFAFGRDPENVQRAIQRLGIRYPVVMDNEALIWSRYGNRQWPVQQVVDRNGFIREVNAGEGNYARLEHAVQSLMLDAGLVSDLPVLSEPIRETDRPGAVSYRAAPELFAGYLRGSMGNVEGYFPESEIRYADPGIYVEGRFYVAGDWSNERDALTLLGESEAHVLLRYSALEVHAVLSRGSGPPADVEVLQDGLPLSAENRGEDIRLSPDGKSFVTVDEPRLYAVVRNREHFEHMLKLTTRGTGTSLYSIAFVPGVIPELISG